MGFVVSFLQDPFKLQPFFVHQTIAHSVTFRENNCMSCQKLYKEKEPQLFSDSYLLSFLG